MDNILKKIVENKIQEVEAQKNLLSEDDLIAFASKNNCHPLSISNALRNSKTGIIAEFKRRSPSRDAINVSATASEVIPQYEKNGAAACSVLTDIRFFGGSFADLAIARNYARIPLLRKDFIVDKYQIPQSLIMGADAILLIASILSDSQLQEYTEIAHQYGLEALVEIHDVREIGKIPHDADLIGVNNRNLSTFHTDIEHSIEIAKALPSGFLKIAESGIKSFETTITLRNSGYSGFLIGERFMRSQNPGDALADFLNS